VDNYYTYAYLREDRTPYYIGRGKGKRAFEKSGHFVKVPPRDRVLFLKTGLTYSESIDHEVYMIAVFGRKNNGTGILRNYTDGGEGMSGFTHSEKSKVKMSKTRRGKLATETHKENIRRGLKKAWSEGRHHDMTGENNPNKDGHHGETNGRSKITDQDRRDIARDFIPGKMGNGNGNCSALAEKYGLDMSRIRRIANDPRWTS
jgi:hypothetical protein